MIAVGRIRPQIERVGELLKFFGLLEARQLKPNHDLKAADFRGLGYPEVYRKCVDGFAYDYKLVDQSIIGFKYVPGGLLDGELSFTYYEAPSSVIPYEEFVALELDVSPDDTGYQALIEYWGDELRPDYESYLTTVALKGSVTPIRYDYSASAYRSGVHPASHMHIGFESSVRIGLKRILNPISFALFIVRQQYPHQWIRLRILRDYNDICRQMRDVLDVVHKKHWEAHDEAEMYLF